MGIRKSRRSADRAEPGVPARDRPGAVRVGDRPLDEGDLDAGHDHPDAHEAAALGAEHTGAERAAWSRLHRG